MRGTRPDPAGACQGPACAPSGSSLGRPNAIRLPLALGLMAMAGALISTSWLGGCSGTKHPVTGTTHEQTAPEERVLHVYNWADYIGRATVAEFERTTGIEVVYDVYDSNQLLESKLLAGDTGYDIVSTTTGFYGRQIRAGAYEPLDKRLLPNWSNLDPEVLAVQAEARSEERRVGKEC